MEKPNRSYEILFWNSEETAMKQDNNTHYSSIMEFEDFSSANKKYESLIRKYEYVVFKIVEKRILNEYHKTSIS